MKPPPDTKLPRHFGEATPVRSMGSTIPEFYETGPKIRGKMLELIEGAEDYILIDSFLVVKSPDSMDVLEALERKRRAGVRIYVLSDSSSIYYRPGNGVPGKGGWPSEGELPCEGGLAYLEDGGIPCVEYNPIRLYKLIVAPTMLPRDHRKFWIVDGKTLFLGGANILAASLNPPEQGGNHDMMVAVESAAAITKMITSFVTDWNKGSRHKLREEDFAVRARSMPETDLWLFDQDESGRGQEVMLKMIDSLFSVAKKEVWLIQPFTFVTTELLERLRLLRDRGVAVNVMLCSRSHGMRYHRASFYGTKDILELGGKVWIHEEGKGTLHTKAIIVDRRCASVGSTNLNHRSYKLAKELNVVFDDPESVGKVVRVLDELKANCRQVGIEESKRYRTHNYYIAWLWMQLMG